MTAKKAKRPKPKLTKSKQFDMFKRGASAYGGELRNRRKGRGQRSISTKHTMHLVLRSSLTKGAWNLRRHDNKIKNITKKYSHKYGVRLISLANVGNHLHMQIQLTNRHTYAPFIKALTSALAMAVTGASYKSSIRNRARELGIVAVRHPKRMANRPAENKARRIAISSAAIETPLRFWDYRPFTRIVHGRQAFLTLRDYIQINRFEGRGYDRGEARFLIFVKNQSSANLARVGTKSSA